MDFHPPEIDSAVNSAAADPRTAARLLVLRRGDLVARWQRADIELSEAADDLLWTPEDDRTDDQKLRVMAALSTWIDLDRQLRDADRDLDAALVELAGIDPWQQVAA